MLSPDFHQRARAKLAALLLEAGRAPPPLLAEEALAEAPPAPALAPAAEQRAPEEEKAPAEDVVGDKIVSLKEAPPRARGSSKDGPSRLQDVDSEEDLAKLTLDGLKRLAKAASVDLPKPLSKPKLLASLLDVYRRAAAAPAGVEEEEEEAALGPSSACTR
jgi:hypothetical protein